MKSEKCLPDEIASRSTLLAPHSSLHTSRFTFHASSTNRNSRKDNKKNP